MKKIIALASFIFAFTASTPVLAGAQQEKMKGCHAEARVDGLKGDNHKAFRVAASRNKFCLINS